MLYFGVIEDKQSDALYLARYKVRIVGVHSHLQADIPTKDLPWATPIQNNSAALSGIGQSATGYLPGSTVVIMFADEDKQIPFILGAISGLAAGDATADFAAEYDSTMPQTAPPDNPTKPYIGKLDTNQVRALIVHIGGYRGNLYNYEDAENNLGLGRYIFTGASLAMLGYVNKDNHSIWLGKNGITNRYDLFNNEALQDAEEENLLKLYYAELKKTTPISDSLPAEKVAGLLMAAHVNGVAGVVKMLTKGDDTNAAGESCLVYYSAGYSFISGRDALEIPTLATINDVIKPASAGIGFADPSGKYPLQDRDEGEPDTPRLATGYKVSETCVGKKEVHELYDTNFKVANSEVTWKQPQVPYNAKYPHNNVYQSPAGHVMEFDDTPGKERIHMFHKEGTFWEVDSHGNSVDKTVGTRTIIVNDDELVYIKGSGHVTIDGDMSLRVAKALHVEILGDANFKVHGNLNYEIDGDYNLKVSGNLNMDGKTVNTNAGASDSVLPWEPVIKPLEPFVRLETFFLDNEIDEPDESKPPSSSAVNATAVIANKTISHGVLKVPTLVEPITEATLLTYGGYKVGTLSVDYRPRSDTHAKDHHNLTPLQVATNMQAMAAYVVEPIRRLLTAVGSTDNVTYPQYGFLMTSCVRKTKIKANGKQSNSKHEYGQAFDFVLPNFRRLRQHHYDVAKILAASDIPFTGLILEYKDTDEKGVEVTPHCWIHVEYVIGFKGPRLIRTFNNDSPAGASGTLSLI